MNDCIFCKLASGEIPTEVVYEDEQIFCFKDANPQAPVHVLIIPKRHIESMDALTQSDEDKALLGHLMTKVPQIAADLGLDHGYRLVNNCGEDGFQTVMHLHFHLLGKRKLTWPPG
jgi:histidine triad (HIT) family protein